MSAKDNSNSNNSSNKIESKLDQLLNSIQIMLESMEKRGRENYPASMIRHFNSGKNYNQFLRERKSFNSTDFANLMNDVMNGLKRELGDLQKNFKDLNTNIEKTSDELQTNTTLTQQQIAEKKKELDDLKKQKEGKAKQISRLEKRIQGGSEREYERRHQVEKWQEGRRYDSSTPEMQKIYGNSKNQTNHRVNNANYGGESSNRAEALRIIAESGLSNTGFGRFTQKLIERQQKIADIENFSNRMANGDAAKISSAMFGNGKMASVAAKGLGGFSKALGGAAKLLGGPVVAGIMAFIDVIGVIGHAVSEFLTHLGNAQALGLETTARITQMAFNQEKETQVANINLQTEAIKKQGDLQLKMMDMQGQIMLNALKLETEQYAKSIGIALGPMLDGINETAYRAAESSIDFASEAQKNQNIQLALERQYANYGKARDVEYQNQIKNTEASLELLSQQTKAGVLEAGQQLQFDINNSEWLRQLYDSQDLYDNEHVRGARQKYRALTGINPISSIDALEQYKKQFGGTIQGFDTDEDFWESFTRNWGLFRMNRETVERIEKGGLQMENMSFLHPADLNAALTQANANLQSTIASYTQQIGDKQIEIEKQKRDIIVDAAAEIKKTWLKLAQNTEKYTEKFDRITNDLGKNLGYTNEMQLNGFQKTMFPIIKEVASRFGKDIEDAVKIQQGFIESTGRNRMFDKHDYGQMLGLGNYLGDDGLATSYASEMEIFNAGVADSVDMLDKVLQDVNKIGLNGRKYTKTLVDSLKLAQKYNFKGGTANLMKMAKWAENTRFNMNSLSSMLDKISEGGLEGVITQGAQFQVLGGHAAMNADPIAMMFERYADPEALMKRYQDMTKGYGSLDRRTGETKFSGTEQMLMEQLAKIQGRSLEEVMNEVRARNKKEVVSRQLNGVFDEDEQSLISNLATYNKKTEQFEVRVKDGNRYVTKDVNQLTKSDLSDLMPEQHNERMEDYMQTVVDLLGKITGEEIREKTDLSEATYSTVIQQYAERIKIAAESYAVNREKYVEESEKGMLLATNSFNDFIRIFEEGNPKVDEQVKKIEDTAGRIAMALQGTADVINRANSILNGAFDVSNAQSPTISKPNFAGNKKPYHFPKSLPRTGPKQTSVTYTISNGLPLTIDLDDGVINSNNNPIMAQANKITKVQDGMGSFVQSDPKDTALFAKDGGPFDTLFNGVFSKINSLYDAYSGHQSTSFNANNGALKVEINGRLELSSGGQSVNIINEIQNNPLLIRALSRMLSEQLSKAFNGGRGTSPIAIGNV